MQQVNPPYIPSGRDPVREPAEASAPGQASRAEPRLEGQKLRLAHAHPAHPQAKNRPLAEPVIHRSTDHPQGHRPQPFVPLAPHAGAEAGAEAHPHLHLHDQLEAHARPQPEPAAPRLSARRQTPLHADPAPRHVTVPRRDPAPSRLAYKLNRLWLRPAVRVTTRIGVPVFLVVLGLGTWLGDADRRAAIVGKYDQIRERIEHQPAFMVSLLKIEGASPEVDAAIRALAPVDLPASSFDIDLAAYRHQITRLDAVADARLVIRSGGTLEIAVTEREPVILWRTHAGIEMLDATGHRVASVVSRDVRADLPLIAGEGADAAVPEALALLKAAGPLLPRIRGLQRMGERRWDIVLDRDQRLMLPETDAVRALDRVLALDAAEDLLARDFTHLDLRNTDRPTIRLSEHALAQFRLISSAASETKP